MREKVDAQRPDEGSHGLSAKNDEGPPDGSVRPLIRHPCGRHLLPQGEKDGSYFFAGTAAGAAG
ncbi:MAG: hypothetical protein KKG89_10810, partial [Alphaproteobacteria bacterium]|nr:hypothetical protein [Alphaproteobacteria bacterium]